MSTKVIGYVDVFVDRSQAIVLPAHKDGDIFGDHVEANRPKEYTLDHLGLWYVEGQEQNYLSGYEIFLSVYSSTKPIENFLSLNDGYALQRLGAKFIEKFGRELQYPLWGTVVRKGKEGHVPIVYGAQKTDEVFIVWDTFDNVFYGKNRPALRFTTPGT